MSRGAMLRAVFGALLLAAAPGLAGALDLPAAARMLSERISPLESYALPMAPFDGTTVPARPFEGRVERRSWRIDGTASTALQLLQPLRNQLKAAGYTVVFECRAQGCGGFDFRFGTEVAPAPQMHVDIGNFRFLSATRGADQALSLLISRTGSSAYIQEIQVQPAVAEPAAPAPGGQVPGGQETQDDSLTDRLLAQGHVVLGDLDFGTGAGTLGAGPYGSLSMLAAFLAANPGYRLVVVGHTDSVGPLEGNLALSRQRAQAVRDRLIADYGADPARVTAEGVGYLAPVAPNLTPEGRDRNRRVEAVLLPAN
ncbi:MAG: OmpA family protein [Pseudodonghicola sp.]